MNTYLINYIKRDWWLENGMNLGMFLKAKQALIDSGFKQSKALKIVKNNLWRAIKKG